MARTIQSLQEDKSHKVKCMEDLLSRAEKENRDLSAEEREIFDKTDAEVVSINDQIKDKQETIDRAEKMRAMKDAMQQSSRDAKPNPIANKAEKVPAQPFRYGSLKAFKPRGGETLQTAEERAYRCGMWIRASIFGDQRAAHWCTNHGLYDALSTTSNPDGGFLVPEEFSQTIIDLREQYGTARQQCQVIPMGRDTILIPRRLTGVTPVFVGENPSSAISQTTPTWNQVRLTAKKIATLSLFSTEIAEDAIISIADWLAQEIAYAFALLEDQCLFIGDGTSTYGGIRGLGNFFTTTGGVGGGQLVGAVDLASGHDTFAEVDITDLQTVMAKLPAYARRNAKWYCSAVCLDLVFGRLMANAGGNTIQNMMGGYGPSYMGYPIVVNQTLPTSTGDLSDLPMFYFGDMSLAVAMGDRRGVTVFPSEHRYMDTDQIGIRATERFDIVVHDYGDTTTGNAGPIVAAVGE